MSLGYNIVLGFTGLIGGAYSLCSLKGFTDNFKKFLFTSENNIFDMLSDGLNVYFWATFICKFLLGNTTINYGISQIIGVLVLIDFIRQANKDNKHKNIFYTLIIAQLSIPYVIAILFIN